MQKENLVSLGDLAIELKVKKSTLQYYYHTGILVPELSAGRMNLFDKDKTVKIIKKISDLKKNGKKVNKMKNIL